MNKKISRGFSLAEALIAVAIIGIIAAITIPTVVANYNQKALNTMLKKNYVELQESLLILKTENYQRGLYGSILNKKGGKTVSDTAGKFLRTYYKLTKDCKTDTQPCFADKYADISTFTEKTFACKSGEDGEGAKAGYSAIVASGAAICIIPAEEAIKEEVTEGSEQPDDSPAVVYIDVNGTQGPNIGGRDMFTFNIYNDFTIDEIPPDTSLSTAETKREELFNDNCLKSSVGKGCFAKILQDNWELNY